METPHSGRRSFLARVWHLAAGGLVLGAATAMWSALGGVRGRSRPVEFDADTVAAAMASAGVRAGAFFVTSLDGRPVAVRMRCTHLGCTLRKDPATGGFVCPCHGSRFDPRGYVVNGPATSPLDVRRLERRGDRWIAASRGARTP